LDNLFENISFRKIISITIHNVGNYPPTFHPKIKIIKNNIIILYKNNEKICSLNTFCYELEKLINNIKNDNQNYQSVEDDPFKDLDDDDIPFDHLFKKEENEKTS
jgi:hypothetical protein